MSVEFFTNALIDGAFSEDGVPLVALAKQTVDGIDESSLHNCPIDYR
jgi:hypothetical protein